MTKLTLEIEHQNHTLLLKNYKGDTLAVSSKDVIEFIDRSKMPEHSFTPRQAAYLGIEPKYMYAENETALEK